WDAFVGRIVPAKVPVPSTQQIQPPERKEFPRSAWEGMDSGESSAPYNVTLFGPASLELGEVVAIGLLGLEVDDEDDAQDSVRDFQAAFWKLLKETIALVLTASGSSFVGPLLAGAALSTALIALYFVALVVVAVVGLIAAWAPADVIAIDIFSFNAMQAWEA